VFLVDRDLLKVRLVPVEIGIIEGDMAEVISPDLEGFVVTVGQHLLQDGSEIILTGKETGPEAGGGQDGETREETNRS
jgi:hypothetical protein